MNPYPDFMVSIRCMTYNHAPYIEDAMNGFCMQQTTFPFVAIIVDDASTDGEPEVIRRYLDAHFDLSEEGVARQWETDDARFVYAQHRENKNCYFAVVFLKYNFWQAKKSKEPLIKEWMGSKYVAFCEGDDYWTHPMKLQLQVDYLTNHPDCGMVYTDFDFLFQEEGIIQHSIIRTGKRPQIKSFDEHLRLRGYIGPMSWLFRKEYISIAQRYKGKPSKDGTFIFALEMFLNSKVDYLNVVTCVYRITPNSASRKTNIEEAYIYSKGLYDTQKYYVDNYPVSVDTLNSLSWFYRENATYIVLNDKKDEIINARKYLRSHYDRNLSVREKLFWFCLISPFNTWMFKKYLAFRKRFDYLLFITFKKK